MGRITTRIAGALIFSAVALAAIFTIEEHEENSYTVTETIKAQEPGRGDYTPQERWEQPELIITDDARLPPPALIIEREGSSLMSIVIFEAGIDGKPVAIIHPNGKVTLNGDPNVAAKRFWEAVSMMMPTCYAEIDK